MNNRIISSQICKDFLSQNPFWNGSTVKVQQYYERLPQQQKLEPNGNIFSYGLGHQSSLTLQSKNGKNSVSLLDNAPDYLDGCVIQKRTKNFFVNPHAPPFRVAPLEKICQNPLNSYFQMEPPPHVFRFLKAL